MSIFSADRSRDIILSSVPTGSVSLVSSSFGSCTGDISAVASVTTCTSGAAPAIFAFSVSSVTSDDCKFSAWVSEFVSIAVALSSVSSCRTSSALISS
uniref:Uncharacterized protein n=1 Tax=Arundo donax TaxID=35708 RepID=A0A0A9AF76_ARUDO